MIRIACSRWQVLIVLAVGVGVANRADASLINLTESVVGSGTFGDVSFTNQLVSISAVYDTSLVVPNDAPFPSEVGFNVNPPITITVAVVGVGSAIAPPSSSISGTLGTVDLNTSVPEIGISIENYTVGNTPFSLSAPMLSGYDLQSAFAPITATVRGISQKPAATSLGLFTLLSTASSGTIQASIVPEPSSIILCGVAGSIALGIAMIRAGHHRFHRGPHP